MFGIGETELVIIVVFAFMLFGPDKMPAMGRTLGRVLRQFREASDGFTEVVQTNIMDPASEELEKSPKQRRREAAERAGEDADVASAATEDGADAEAPAPRRETFAERKARLAAERAAREQEEAARESGDADAASDTTDEDATAAPNAASAEVDTPQPTTAADLYAVSGTSGRKRPARTQAEPGDSSNDESDAVPADAATHDASAGASAPDETASTDATREEDEDGRA